MKILAQKTSSGAGNSAAPARFRRLRKARIVAMRSILLLLFALGFFLSVIPWGRAVMRSTLLIPAMLTASQPAPLLWSGEPIKHSQLTVPSLDGSVDLDLYAPATSTPLVSPVRGGILVISGVGDNRQVPQLINLFEGLAHSGMVVMNMTAPMLVQYDLSLNDVDAAVQSFKALSRLPALVGKHIGIISFSAGVPFACFAAADPRIRDDVAYVTAFGGYFNTKTLLRTFGRRAQDIDGRTVPWHPIDIPIQVLGNVSAHNFSPDEASTLRSALAPNSAPLTANDLARLSPGAQATYRLLTGRAPEQVDADIAALPPSMQNQLEELSPSRVVGQIHAPIFLLHDIADPSLPVTETRAFAAALTRLQHPHQYLELHIFDHVEVRTDLNIWPLLGDGMALFKLLNDMLALNS